MFNINIATNSVLEINFTTSNQLSLQLRIKPKTNLEKKCNQILTVGDYNVAVISRDHIDLEEKITSNILN